MNKYIRLNGSFKYCLIFSIITTFLLSFGLMKINSNIIYYVALCSVFLVSFFIALFIFKNIEVEGNKNDILIFIFTIILFVFFYISDSLPINSYSTNKDNFAWHGNLLFVVLEFVFFILIIWFIQKKRICVNKYIYYLSIVLLCVLTFFINYQVYTTDMYSMYHRHAYLYEIYKCYSGVPYTSTTSSIYGHYGLFFLLPLKLLGGYSLKNVILLISIGYIIGLVLFKTILDKITNNTFIKILSCVAYIFPLVYQTDGSLYYQLTFHRIILVVLFVYNIINYNNTKKASFIFYISSMFALLWSSDIGIIYNIGYLVFNILTNILFDKGNVVHSIFISIIKTMSIILLSVLIINIYNYLSGGDFVIGNLFYPLNDGVANNVWEIGFNLTEYCKEYLNYFINYAEGGPLSNLSISVSKFLLNNKLESILLSPIFYLYFWNIVFLLSLAIYSLFNIDGKFYHRLLIICIFGLGVMVYYMNRPAYGNLNIVLPIDIFVLIYMREKFSFSKYKLLSVSLIIYLFSFSSIISIPETIKSVNNNSNYNSYEIIENLIEMKVSKDAFIVGIGSYEINDINEYKNISTMDDINFVGSNIKKEEFIKELNSNKNLLILDKDLIEYVCDDYRIDYLYDENNMYFCYFYKLEE